MHGCFSIAFPIYPQLCRVSKLVLRIQVTTSFCLCIQGITYDTGGADIKHGGTMAGMHRDKCGAAFVAGFFEVCLCL